MLKKKGIVRKTFIFSVMLIALTLLLSFLALYFIMPGYYHYIKSQTLQLNLNRLVASLKTAQDQAACSALIANYVTANNANVMSFGANDTLLIELSTPFVWMVGDESADMFFTVIRSQSDEPGEPFAISIRQKGTAESPEAGLEIKTVKTHVVSRTESLVLNGYVGSNLIDHVVVSSTLQPIDEAKGVVLSLLPYVLVIGIVLALAFAWLYASQISKPILSISDAAIKMQRLDPDALSGIRTDDELGALSANLDTLYEKLRENISGLNLEMEKTSRLERSKTEMMQSASHELRTPIAALSGMLDGMIDNVGTYKDRNKYLEQCKTQVEKLSLLVGEILSASKSDLAGQEIAPEKTCLDALVRQALDEYKYQLEEKRLRVEATLPEAAINTDPAAMYRVLTNLVSNAARYTPPDGAIRIELNEKELSIENECESIADEELVKLFEPFYTLDFSRDRSKSGVGLGLYIVKRNLEKLGIPFRAESTGAGFRISLDLPR